MMGAYAIPLPVEPKAQLGQPILPWSIGLSEQDRVTARGQLQLLFGLELESHNLRTRGHEAQFEGASLVRQQPLAQRETKSLNAKFAILSGFYTVRNPIAVQEFLVDRRPLFNLLFAALPKVKETWGADTKTELELLHDPEDDSSSLVVHVLSNHPNKYAALDHFDEQWWLNHIGESEGLLNFSVEP